MNRPQEQAGLEKLSELLEARIPAKWWWCDFTVKVRTHNLNGKREENGLFEAIQETIKIAQKAEEEKGNKKSQLPDMMYGNIREIGDKVKKLQDMEKLMQYFYEAKQGADKNQIRKLANLQLDLAEEFRRTNGLITVGENEIIQKINQIVPTLVKTQTWKNQLERPAQNVEEVTAPPDTEISSLVERVKRIDYQNIPLLIGIQNQINETLKRVRSKQTKQITEGERKEILNQLKFWADGEKHFTQLANITLEALELGYAAINGIPIEYVRTFVEYQDQIPLQIDLTNQMIKVAREKQK